jgi:hypothetical protein
MAVETLKIVLTADNKQALLAMRETVTSLEGVSVASGKAGGATGKLGKDFTGMSRVIQDLPYGFNAISNNLTQLVPAAGAAGLAFSGIVTAITFAQIGFGAWTRGMEAADEGMKASTKTVAEFDVNIINATNNITAARQGVISKDDALKKYNESLGETVGYARSLDEAEKLMANNAATVSQSIMLKTQAQILYQKSAELSAKTITGEIYDLSLLEKATIVAKSAFGGMTSVAVNVGEKMGDNFKSATEDAKKLKEQGDALTKQSLDLQKTLVGSRTAPQSGGGGGKPKEVAVKDENKALEEQIQIYKRLQAQMMGQGFITQEKAKAKDLTNLKLTMDGNAALNEITATQLNLKDQMNARTELANALTERAMQGISGVANAMANGGNIGQAFGDMFKQLAIDIALAAAKAAIFQAILSAINPVGGASKAGGFLKGFGKLLGFAEGGTVSGPTSGYPVMLHGTEHIVRPDQMKSIIASASQMGGSGASKVIVEGRIQGQDIWLSQQRTNTFRGLTN